MTKPVDDLVLKRSFKCTKRQLFDAWSQPSLMSNWLFGRREDFRKSTVTNSFHVGGAYSITMHMTDTDIHIFGRYTEIVRYNRIAFTWTSPVATGSQVNLEFAELSANRSELTLIHSLFATEDARTSHGKGWHVCLDHLNERLFAARDG